MCFCWYIKIKEIGVLMWKILVGSFVLSLCFTSLYSKKLICNVIFHSTNETKYMILDRIEWSKRIIAADSN